MSYTAKNLEEVVVLFEALALGAEARCDLASTDEIYSVLSQGHASGLRQAARILRNTTLTEPCHMEKL